MYFADQIKEKNILFFFKIRKLFDCPPLNNFIRNEIGNLSIYDKRHQMYNILDNITIYFLYRKDAILHYKV